MEGESFVSDRELKWKQRQRGMRENLEEAWKASRQEVGDPGIREAYGEVPRLPIRLIVCPLNKDVNQGGLLRLAEAFRIEFVEMAPAEDGVDLAAHRGAQGWQPWEWRSAHDAVDAAIARGDTLAALTLSDRSVDIREAPWKFPLSIVVGSERRGVRPEIEAKCHFSVGIPLWGLVTSLNVATATGIALHEAVRHLHAQEPEWSPARASSRQLLGLPAVDYWGPDQE